MKDKGKKVLSIYVYDKQHELVEMTTRLLNYKGVIIDAVCVSTYRYFKGSRVRWPLWIFIASFFINALHFPKSQGLFRRWLGNSVIKDLIPHYDLIDFGSFPASQIELAEYCIDNNKEYILHFWGSDILRATDDYFRKSKNSFDHAKYLRLTKKMAERIRPFYIEQYGIDYSFKFKGGLDGIFNGNKDYDVINSLSASEIQESGKQFGGGSEKLIVTIGYNGIPAQNHERVLECLSKLSSDIKKRIHLVIPMTYGANANYLERIKMLAACSGISNVVLEKFLSNKEVCVLRLITNVFVMVQDTDGFAASVRSHVYCQNVCLIADWLDYPMTGNGVYYERVNWDNLLDTFTKVIQDYEAYKSKCLSNKERMLPFMTWDKYIDFICSLYK